MGARIEKVKLACLFSILKTRAETLGLMEETELKQKRGLGIRYDPHQPVDAGGNRL